MSRVGVARMDSIIMSSLLLSSCPMLRVAIPWMSVKVETLTAITFSMVGRVCWRSRFKLSGPGYASRRAAREKRRRLVETKNLLSV